MSILKRKKKSVLPSGDDYKVLDGSVNDLSKQTSELLSHFGEKKEEVNTPKKASTVKSVNTKRVSGKSFDIIAPSSKRHTSTKISAPIKDDEVLLPEHAGKSFNELDFEEMPPKQSSAPEIITNKGSIINSEDEAPSEISHTISTRPPGSLHFQESEAENEKMTDLVDEKEEPNNAEEPELSQELEPKVETEVVPLVPSVEEEKSETDTSKVDDDTKPEEEVIKSDEAVTDHAETILSENDSNSGELYVNNLVKTTDKKGYVAPEGQQKPTVFDTNEYHPQLHDWSKLENKNGVKGYFLALLLVVAGALAYLILSGTQIPFIGNFF